MAKPRKSLAGLGLGLAYTLTGLVLLLQALDIVQVRWSLVAPGIVLLSGLAVLLSGIVGDAEIRTGHPDQTFDRQPRA